MRGSLDAGSYVWLLYAPPDDDMFHERLILAWVVRAEYIVLTPDFDMFIEQVDSNNADLSGLRFGDHSGTLPFGLTGAAVYRFAVKPSGRDLQGLLVEGERMAQSERQARGSIAAARFLNMRLQM